MDGLIAKPSGDDPIELYHLTDLPHNLLSLIVPVLEEAKNLQLPADLVSSFASSDLVRLIRGESSSIPTALTPLTQIIRELILRNPHLINHVLKNSRPREILTHLAIFENFPTTPSFAGAHEITGERAAAAFARAAAVARGESPIKSRPRMKAPPHVSAGGAGEDVPGLIALEEPPEKELPSVEMLMNEHGLSRKGAEAVRRRLEEKLM